MPGLADQPKAGRKDHAVTPPQVERIVSLGMSPPPKGYSRWSTLQIGDRVKLTSSTVARVLRANDLKPHLARVLRANDLKPPGAHVQGQPGSELRRQGAGRRGAVLEPAGERCRAQRGRKTQSQALERTQLSLPLRPGRVRTHTHDYERHGVLDLYAALNVGTGEVTHQCVERHTAKEFLAFLKLLLRQPRGRELHVIIDNSSAHGTPAVRRWLEKHPNGDFRTKTSLRKHIEAFLDTLGDTFQKDVKPPDHALEGNATDDERVKFVAAMLEGEESFQTSARASESAESKATSGGSATNEAAWRHWWIGRGFAFT